MFHHIFRSFILDICLSSVFVLSLRPEINNNQKMNKIKTTKLLAIGIIVMGFVHIAATFTPMIADKLAPLNERMQQSCIYFSLMCGALLILGGSIVHMLCDKSNEHSFLRVPLLLIYSMLAVDGILAVCFMPHNPCAWVIFVVHPRIALVL
jgi:hypothetical protein